VTEQSLSGRNMMVTGANSGIGRAMVEALAARGANVVLACRSEARTRPVLELIRSAHPGISVHFLPLDVSDLESVRAAAGRYLAEHGALDVLVNNAGIAGTRALSRQGFDLTCATNHIGPFLLTNLLLPRLRESAAARIVNVSSEAHRVARQMDWTALERRGTPQQSGFREYAVSKLMNVLHARELARRLTGTGVTTYAVHPGAVASNVWRALPGPVQWFIKLFMLSNEEGARTPLYCATAPELAGISGRYYSKGREISPSPLADDPALAQELWQRTEAAIAAAGA